MNGVIESITELMKSPYGARVALGDTSMTYDRTKRRWRITFQNKQGLQEEFVVEMEFEAVQILINVSTQEAE